MLGAVLSGLAVGGAHALTGPDHLAAVVPLSLDDRPRGLRTGLAWGVGHGAGIAALALAWVILRGVFEVEVVSHGAEAVVGLLLIATGVWVATRASGRRRATTRHAPLRVAFGIGTVHGTAGLGHLLGVLPALAMSTTAAATYLAAVAIGAAVAMAAVGWAAGGLTARLDGVWERRVSIGCGVLAAGIGAAWLALALTG